MSDTLSPDDFLEGSSLPAVKFPDVGSTVKGDVVAARVGTQRKFGTNEVDTWDDGTPKRQLQIDLRTAEGDMRLYCKPACKDAISEAVKAVGGRLSDGGTLTVRRVEDGQASQAGFNPPQQFKAKFEPKVADTAVDDLDDF
jgi:hypothetical protein